MAHRKWAQAGRFIGVGIVSTAAYVVLYAVLRGPLSAGAANTLALVVTAVGNTAANRRLTFGIRGRHSLVRDHAAGLLAFAIALVITSGAIWLLYQIEPGADRSVELLVLVLANALATLLRFVILRRLISRTRTGSATVPILEGAS
jgi:putative flippase GtrA